MHIERKNILAGPRKFHYRWEDRFGEKLERAQVNLKTSLNRTQTLNAAQIQLDDI